MNRKSWMMLLLAAVLVGLPAAAQLPITVSQGDDGWVTQGGGLTSVNLTGWDLSTAFPGGSVSGDAVVNLKGKPIKSSQMGSIDTIVRHTGTFSYTFFGQTQTIPVQIVGLSMVSDNDSVTISGWGTYTLEVYLSKAKAGTGSMSVTLQNGDGGTFSSSFSVYPVVIFVNTANPSDRVRLDCGALSGSCGAIRLNSSGTGWVRTGGPGNFNPTSAGVTPLPAGVAYDADGDGVNDTTTIGRSNTFIPGFAATPPFDPAAGTHNHADFSANHITKPPQDCKTTTSTSGTLQNVTGAAVANPTPIPVLCPIQAEPAEPVGKVE